MVPMDLLLSQNPWWRDGAVRRAEGYPVRRDLQPRILEQVQRADRRALILMGPRQVEKRCFCFSWRTICSTLAGRHRT